LEWKTKDGRSSKELGRTLPDDKKLETELSSFFRSY